jgi:hypothetical protein
MTSPPPDTPPSPAAPEARPPSAPGILARLARLLRVEDLLFAALGLFGLPLLGRLIGLGSPQPVTSEGPTAFTGAFGLVAIAGVLACLCTRGAGEPAPFGDGSLTFEGWARFPLVAGVGIVATQTLPGLGIDGDPVLGLALVAVTLSVLAYRWLPVVPAGVRRALVIPMGVLATAAFDDLMGGGLADATRELLTGQAPPGAGAFLPLIIGVVAALYAALVAAPRAIADPGATWLTWAFRFAFLLVALATGDLVFGPA